MSRNQEYYIQSSQDSCSPACVKLRCPVKGGAPQTGELGCWGLMT